MRYAEARPDQLSTQVQSGAAAVVPIGALEWHGPHLPLGLDGLVAEGFAERIARRIGGVLLPTVWHPMTTLPHPFSLDVPTETFRQLIHALVMGLDKAGFQTLCLVTGHYAHGHHVELYQCAKRAMETFGHLRVFAATPLELLGEPVLLDHAARYETSQLLAIRPELVELGGLPEITDPKDHATLGAHPSEGSAAEGEALFARALDAWERWIQQTDTAALFEHYAAAGKAYDTYVRAYYRDSWEQAILAWWEAM